MSFLTHKSFFWAEAKDCECKLKHRLQKFVSLSLSSGKNAALPRKTLPLDIQQNKGMKRSLMQSLLRWGGTCPPTEAMAVAGPTKLLGAICRHREELPRFNRAQEQHRHGKSSWVRGGTTWRHLSCIQWPVEQTILFSVTGSSSGSILINGVKVSRGSVWDAADTLHCVLGSVVLP